MSKFRVDIDQTFHYTMKEIEADNANDAKEIAFEMIHDMSDDVIQEQEPYVECSVIDFDNPY